MITGLAGWAILIIVIAAIIAVIFVITKAMGVAIPQWVMAILWIIFAAVVGVVAIKFLVSIL